MVSRQAEVISFLSEPENYPGGPPKVDRIDTHGAMVFLAGDEVWKIKRDVDLPYMDFSTLEKRRKLCEREVALNRQTAPQLYLGAVAICRDRSGRLNLEGRGEPVEWAVRMRRFEQEALLEAIASRGRLTDDLVRALAAHIAAYHRKLDKAQGVDFAATMQRIAVELTDGFARLEQFHANSDRPDFARLIHAAVATHTPLLLKRSRDGFVRRCHGDLHLRNIVVLDGAPVLFDALEFDEGFATTDILYDVAFLVMDLWQKELRRQANLLLNRYLIHIGMEENLEGLAAMPLFLAVRAAIKAMVAGERAGLVTAGKAAGSIREAKEYFAAALRYLAPEPAQLIAIGGLSGTGKSTLAAAIACRVGAAPGALHLRSDVERKLLHGVVETHRLDEAAYSLPATQRVYEVLMRKTRQALRAGRAVIVDAVFARPEERSAIEHVAREAGWPFHGIWLSAPPDVLLSRVAGRTGDASDADAAVVARQLLYETGPLNWTVMNAGAGQDGVQRECERLLALDR
jgi:aminoglycoside phosphotransferase family enzyme/predicted kinase